IDPDIRQLIKSSNCLFFDLIEEFIGKLESELHRESSHTIGRYHGRTDEGVYDQRIHAVNYALSTDDGTATKNYDQADVVLLGVSRTGKTPTCVYMGLQFGINAANYPLTEDDFKQNAIELPHVLNLFRDKLYGLTINPKRLQMIRSERRPGSLYSSLQQCQMELSQAEMLYATENIPYLNVTSMSVEEIASTILLECNLHRHVL
ncbi:MAG: kinase/pyrophosphorylase, partial [Syntrophales bacterium]